MLRVYRNKSFSIRIYYFFIDFILIGELLDCIPALIILSINIFADPSKIGTSSLSISTKALSIPRPKSAALNVL